MANIIEQQDLLKGLPDARLSLLLQKPDASIPPFLVAAEAQRRQAIRQQFAGDGNKESVVDTLTKQLSNVPQNIQAPMQTPPQIPQPQPQMAGIGALPQGQQAMAAGGAVQRYGLGGDVVPSESTFDYVRRTYPVSSLPGFLSNTASSIGGYISDAWNSDTAKHATDRAKESVGRAIDVTSLNPWTSQILGLDPASVRESRKKSEIAAIQANNPMAGQGSSGPAEYDTSIKQMERLSARPAVENKTVKDTSAPDTTTAGTSAENKAKAEEADFRKRIKELYGVEEPSNWEEAQKWFAMSQAIMQPDQNLMQSLAGAGAIYAGAEGQQAADQRAAKRDQEEALLKYDLQKYSSDREQEIANAAARVKAQTDISTGQISDIRNERNRLYDQLSRIQEDADKNGIPVDPARIAAIQGRIDSLGAELESYKSYIQNQYGFNMIPTVDTKAGTVRR